ncbi:MAG: GntR family transcriptional regulator [Actinobacteria bacterium]|nr:GntR family transcriptional regulator [Actinomycetota bacterium]
MSSHTAPMGGPLSKALLSDQVYELVRARLIAHEYEPGTRLVESEIARQLSVSQAPVRDALRRLSHEGLVLQVPRRGSFVAEVSTEEARDAYQLRAALEGFAVVGAVEHLTDEVLADLEHHIEEMHEAAADDDMAAFIDADVRFHKAVWEASGNSLLPRVWALVEPTMRNLTTVSNRVFFQNLAEIADTHHPLVEGLRRRDPAVGDLFREHALHIWRLLAEGSRQGGSDRPHRAKGN